MQKGDSLYAIARKLGTTVDNLKSINNLTTDALSIGQILKVPTENGNVSTPSTNNAESYVVQKGDSLYAIAQKYNTSVDELKAINNLKSNLLNVGQVLKVPVKSNSSNNIYTVQKGDSLYSIARKYDTSVDELIALNNLSTNVLSIGQKLLIP